MLELSRSRPETVVGLAIEYCQLGEHMTRIRLKETLTNLNSQNVVIIKLQFYYRLDYDSFVVETRQQCVNFFSAFGLKLHQEFQEIFKITLTHNSDLIKRDQ